MHAVRCGALHSTQCSALCTLHSAHSWALSACGTPTITRIIKMLYARPTRGCPSVRPFSGQRQSTVSCRMSSPGCVKDLQHVTQHAACEAGKARSWDPIPFCIRQVTWRLRKASNLTVKTSGSRQSRRLANAHTDAWGRRLRRIPGARGRRQWRIQGFCWRAELGDG